MSEPDGTKGGTPPSPALTGKGPASDLALADSIGELVGRTVRIYFRCLWPMVVAVGVPSAALALLAQALLVWGSREAAYINGALTLFSPGRPLLVAAVTLLALGLLLVPALLATVVFLGGGALLGRPVSVRDAWRKALRRYFTVLTWFVLTVVLFGMAVAAVVGLAVFAESPVWLAVGIVAVPVLLILAPLSVMVPVALLEGRGPWRALATAWRIGRNRRFLHLGFVLGAHGVSVLTGTGLEWLLDSQLGWGQGHPASLAVTPVVAVLAMPLSGLLMCAPVVYGTTYAYLNVDDVHVEVHNLDLTRVAAELPGACSGKRAWAVMPVPALVGVLLLPLLVGPPTMWANPFDTPWVTRSEVGTGSEDSVIDMASRGSQVLVAVGRLQCYHRQRVCPRRGRVLTREHARVLPGWERRHGHRRRVRAHRLAERREERPHRGKRRSRAAPVGLRGPPEMRFRRHRAVAPPARAPSWTLTPRWRPWSRACSWCPT